MLNSVYVGDNPSAFAAAETALGLTFGASSDFTGGASWSDYDTSVGWEIGQMRATGAPTTLWAIPLFPTGANLQTAATGAYDSHYTAAAQQLAAAQPTGPINVRTGWEFNGSWYAWTAQSDPASYVAAFQQFVSSYRAVSNRFTFTWNPNVGSDGMADVSAAYPGDAYVNYIGVDFYDNNAYLADPLAAWNTALTEPYGLNWLVSFAAAHHKQLAVPEWAVSNNNDAAFVTLAAAWMKANNVAYESYWDFNGSFDGTLNSKPLVAAAFTAAFSPAGTVLPPPPAPAHGIDLDGDGKSDILLRHANGTVGEWESSNGLGPANQGVLSDLTNDWKIAGAGDFDGDGRADILWRQDSGTVALWESTKGLNSQAMVKIGWVGDVNYQVQGVGDFDGDGKADVLWRNGVTGDTVLWDSSKGWASASVALGPTSLTAQVQAVGDFDGDGKADILWRDTTTGDITIWESGKGLNAAHAVELGAITLDWQTQFVGDFDGDHKADILWRNVNNGHVGLWESSKGLDAAHYVDLGVVSNDWKIVGVGDYDGDHKTDILWENMTTHDFGLWQSTTGLGSAHYVDLGVLGANWQVATTHYDVV